MPRALAAPHTTRLLRSGPGPRYWRLCESIRERVAAGEWQPGGRIPTIRELGETYGVSHITVVEALGALSGEGLVTRWQGKGIFVSKSGPEHGPVSPLSFTEEMLKSGQMASSRMLRLERQPAGLQIAARLGLEVGDSVILVERLRLADGTPVGVQRAFLPERIVPGLVDQTEAVESLYRLLIERYGVMPSYATESYIPIRLDGEQARLLGVRTGAAAFSVERCTTDQHRRLVEYVQGVLRGDRYKVVLQLSRS